METTANPPARCEERFGHSSRGMPQTQVALPPDAVRRMWEFRHMLGFMRMWPQEKHMYWGESEEKEGFK